MAAAYFENKESAEATFELFVRNLPKNRSYLVAAGLEQAVEYLQNLHFEKEHIDFLRKHPVFKGISNDFFSYLLKLRFSGDVWALPEGTVFFANEPIMRVTAPIIEAQIVETFLLSTINFQTLIATKASRIVQSARVAILWNSVAGAHMVPRLHSSQLERVLSVDASGRPTYWQDTGLGYRSMALWLTHS